MEPYYQDGSVTIYHGDCLEVMGSLDVKADLVFTSPPYNLGLSTGGFPTGPAKGRWSGGALAAGYEDYGDDMPYAEYVAWQKEVLARCWQVLSPDGAIFYNHKPRVQALQLQTPLDLNPGLPLRQIIVWDRGAGMNFSPSHYVPMHEWIVVMAGPNFRLKSKEASGVGDVWRVPFGMNTEHPAPFPLGLPAKAIESTGATMVLDPFVGSGTTLRAAKDAGVSAIGIERNERYCEMAVRRLGQEVMDFGEAA